MKRDVYPYALIAARGFLDAVLRWFIDLQIPSLPGTGCGGPHHQMIKSYYCISFMHIRVGIQIL